MVRDYEKLQKKFEETDKTRKELEGNIVAFKQESKASKEQMDALVSNLQADHAQLMRQVEHAHVKEEETKESNERRFKAVVNKLQQLEDEHGQCK
jgi:septal ring factor EnvC (AmiA/AmiB activator)